MLVTATGLVFSFMTEFIENPGEHSTKPDCELKAFYRLVDRLKQRCPRLPLGLLLDCLFAGGPTFTRCGKYVITIQDGDLPSVHQDFEALTQLAPEKRLHFTPSSYPPVTQDFRWVKDLPYVDTERWAHHLSVMDAWRPCLLRVSRTRLASVGCPTPPSHPRRWSPSPIKEVDSAGRSRTKASTSKNGGYALEHVYTRNPTAAKVFYFLLQIAQLFSQLMARGNLFRRSSRKGGSQDPCFSGAGSLAQFAPHACRDLGPHGRPLPDSLRYIVMETRVPALAPFSACPARLIKATRESGCAPVRSSHGQAASACAKDLALHMPNL